MTDLPALPPHLADLAPAEAEPLAGGTYNTVWRLRLADGRRLILKQAPDAPGLSYERELLPAEAEYFRAAAGAAPVPEVLSAADDHVLMTEVPGVPWPERDAELSPADRAALRRELGALVGRLHAVTGTRFGYPGTARPSGTDWRGTFLAMLDELLADAERFAAPLPVPPARIAELAKAAGPALDEVTTPVLVHFDLWPGNVLLTGGDDGRPRVGGLIDGERMFWGDPLAEFPSLTLLAGPEPDEALLAGYLAAGGTWDPGASARARLALYHVYLDVIMLTEGAPRRYDAARLDWAAREVTPHLAAALTVLGA